MQAIYFERPGNIDVLDILECEKPKPTENQLLVKVHACGINRVDVLQRKGIYETHGYESHIMGLEIAGEVVEIGNNVTRYAPGDRVFGLVNGGGYAQYCVIDQEMTILMPPSWDYTFAAAIPEAFLTANETLFTLGKLSEDQRVLIHAAGSGVGTVAVQMARYVGAKIFFTVRSDEKLKKVLNLVDGVGVNILKEDYVEKILEATSQEGVDLVEDFVGGPHFEKNLRVLRRKGRLIQVGFMGGSRAHVDLANILFKELQIKGFVMRKKLLPEKRLATQRFKQHWMDPLLNKQIFPIIDKVFDWKEIKQAHAYMEQNKNFGKLVLNVDH